MASRAPGKRTASGVQDWRTTLKRSLIRSITLIGSAALAAFTVFLALALLSYHGSDPSMNTVASDSARNIMGLAGSYSADFLLWLLGIGGGLLLPLLLIFSRELWIGMDMQGWSGQLGRCVVGILLVGLALAMFDPAAPVGLPAGRGGIVALLGGSGILGLTGLIPDGYGIWVERLLLVCSFLGGLVIWYRALELDKPLFRFGRPRLPSFSLRGLMPVRAEDSIYDPDEETNSTRKAPPRPAVADTPKPPIRIEEPDLSIAQRTSGPTGRQQDMFGNTSLPPADLLGEAPPSVSGKIDRAALERNARLLESVLDDFHVKGHITEVRPGPVVTMYELEPAPGIKASRVIQLADDIARNMSALSARVATIPGRTVIGIELPNAKRDSVVLRELITSDAFADQNAQLPIVLGKNISGEPIIADLAPMPHLLIAGTTGSGKSVGLNCMILSLLYRMTPDQLRLIMIDPKMLELSTYDDIPHLLSPVVTEPAKAIRALKWAVEQMEDRYRMMASISVRNLANYNEKVRAAKAKGKPLGRRVQTGYDPETGQPVYEEEQLDFQPLPQIVVVVDELADLMMTAGKEVEFLIQRLAQKARAAGIHLILATQRPSVDVITGVIKANLPTRISFFVTSKIDSRTILGEQGAEQLLGKGDMLYMAGGKALTRVHGPFVSDDEVRAVADHWRAQGQPDYIAAVTEEPEDGGFALDGVDLGDDSPDAQLFRKACQLVFENQKASTSWLQRQLRIGYNSAARLIERMENEGMVGAPNHVGRREVLRDENGNPL
ncbi:FtsK/SpoIIIE family DNA translocase [Sphingobium subterraneum]|uniref:DNA translocase FtsK n=1 Tax=Sphingobium subterraneum TaxID=627688 RepID=A0A841J781_9SPHN|nr:DNA translocase FtsK 4TM domain-containing protein [Sphingobium subterraneum]MBB6124408.1 S-DNA-T family DNA segregation ATPase FtsK/SpoIIIE [Sphingobium subterraneum]